MLRVLSTGLAAKNKRLHCGELHTFSATPPSAAAAAIPPPPRHEAFQAPPATLPRLALSTSTPVSRTKHQQSPLDPALAQRPHLPAAARARLSLSAAMEMQRRRKELRGQER